MAQMFLESITAVEVSSMVLKGVSQRQPQAGNSGFELRVSQDHRPQPSTSLPEVICCLDTVPSEWTLIIILGNVVAGEYRPMCKPLPRYL